MKPPTAKGNFRNNAVCFDMIVRNAIDEYPNINQKDREWFCEQSEQWIRYLHANNRLWKNKINRDDETSRDYLIMFANHWALAFNANPEQYKTRHPLELLLS